MTQKVEKVILIGDAITAEIFHDILHIDKHIEIIGFAVNAEYHSQSELKGKPVYKLEELHKTHSPDQCKLLNAVGYSNVNKNRESTFQQAKQQGYKFLTYIHPKATVMSDQLGEGVIVMAGAVIEPHAKVGDNSILWANTVVAHHASIAENCWIAAGSVVAGQAKINRNVFLGVNSTVVNQITVAEYNIVGANVLVSKDTQDNTVLLARSGEKHRFDSFNYAKFYGL